MSIGEWKNTLKSARVEYIVVHAPWNTYSTMSPADLGELERHFQPVFRDKTETVFRVD
jgi:hypothetical protein